MCDRVVVHWIRREEDQKGYAIYLLESLLLMPVSLKTYMCRGVRRPCKETEAAAWSKENFSSCPSEVKIEAIDCG